MKTFSLLIGLLILFGCGSTSSTEDVATLKQKIEQKEEQLSKLSADMRPHQKIPVSERDELVQLLVDFHKKHPKDEYAAVCLDKLHMIYSSEGDYIKSSAYGDTLLNEYPAYKSRPLIIESMAVNYDIFIQPRDTSKVRYYYELLLSENKDLPEDKVKGIKFKLDNLGLSMEELIKKVNE